MRIRGTKKAYEKRRGYTLAELAVSMGVFTIVVSIATSTVIRAFRTQRQVVALIATNNNVSLTIEQIAREMRTGSGFSLVSSSEITFTNAKGENILYRLNSAAIERGVGNPGTISPITSDNVSVKYLKFYLYAPVNFPPRITVSLGISPKDQQLSNAIIDLQTTISPRFL